MSDRQSARAQLAETLRAAMEREGPDYESAIDNLLADKHLVAAAMGASFMVPVKVLEG